MAQRLAGRRIAVLAADGVDQVELVEPRRAVEDAGATTELLSIKEGELQAVNKDVNLADKFPVDKLVSQATPDEYDALLLPGGVANPDNLRMAPAAVSFVKAFVESGKPVGVICHGPLTLVEAGVVRGRTLTSYPSARADIRNPHDLPARPDGQPWLVKSATARRADRHQRGHRGRTEFPEGGSIVRDVGARRGAPRP